MQLIDPAYATSAVSMGLACTGVSSNEETYHYAAALASWRQALGNGHYHLPFFLALDLSLLIAGGHSIGLRSEEAAAVTDTPARLRYGREIIGRLLQTSCVMEAIDLVNAGPGSDAARQHLGVLLLEALASHWPKNWGLHPGVIRTMAPDDFSSMDPTESARRFSEAYPDLPGMDDSLNEFVNSATARLQWSRFLVAEDYFELSHLQYLTSPHLRLGCRQIIGLVRELAAVRLPAFDLRRHDADSETAFIDETTYPTGGFSGLTNQGALENLLTSELAYMDDTPGSISLFDMRYVEGELLYYLRDEGTMRRRRRTIHFIIDLDDLFFYQFPGSPGQNGILAQALCLRIKEDLNALFEQDALQFHFHLLPLDSPQTLGQESGLLRVILANDIAHGRISLQLPPQLDLTEIIDPLRKTYAVVITPEARADLWRNNAKVQVENGNLHCVIYQVDSADTSGGISALQQCRADIIESLLDG